MGALGGGKERRREGGTERKERGGKVRKRRIGMEKERWKKSPLTFSTITKSVTPLFFRDMAAAIAEMPVPPITAS